MGIKTEAKAIDPNNVPEYPMLRRWDDGLNDKDEGTVVLFTSECTGVCLVSSNPEDKVGKENRTWIHAHDPRWHPCEITLSSLD